MFLMCFVACWAATDVSQLRKLYDADRMFELRRALIENAVADEDASFYRAAVEARFGHEVVAIDQITRFVETHPDSQLLRKASEEMAGAFERLGRYGDAARAWSEALRREPADDPERADDLNTQQLYETLRDVPAQTVTLDDSGTIQARRNGLGTWNVPVDVNGLSGDWIFDTGANLSTITESEARRMKLTVRDTATYVSGSTGKKNPLRLAVATICGSVAHLCGTSFSWSLVIRLCMSHPLSIKSTASWAYQSFAP